MEQLIRHLKDIKNVEGAIVDFRIYDGTQFIQMINIEELKDKKFIGYDTFCGLGVPSSVDLKNPNKNEILKEKFSCQEITTRSLVLNNSLYKNYIIQKIDNTNLVDQLYSFALIDLKQYLPTKRILDHVWRNINYGGTIFIKNYDEHSNHSQHLAVKEFLNNKLDDIDISRQMLVDGKRETFIAIKCYNKHYSNISFKKSDKKISIALVLKTGGEVYNYKYVNALAASIKDNITKPHELVCITDDSTNFSSNIDRVIPFIHNYPKWWGKIELFNSNNFDNDQIFYFDLDTVIIKNIDNILEYDGIFSGLRDFYKLYNLGSGIMAWNKNYTNRIYDKFIINSTKIINNYRFGDQEWIDEQKPSVDYLQDMFPKEIVSFKRHCAYDNRIVIPNEAKIVCFHGNPRPHTIENDILKKYW